MCFMIATTHTEKNIYLFMYIKYEGKCEQEKLLNKWELKEQRFLINKYYTIYSKKKDIL